jgi:hypothetical protein
MPVVPDERNEEGRHCVQRRGCAATARSRSGSSASSSFGVAVGSGMQGIGRAGGKQSWIGGFCKTMGGKCQGCHFVAEKCNGVWIDPIAFALAQMFPGRFRYELATSCVDFECAIQTPPNDRTTWVGVWNGQFDDDQVKMIQGGVFGSGRRRGVEEVTCGAGVPL